MYARSTHAVAALLFAVSSLSLSPLVGCAADAEDEAPNAAVDESSATSLRSITRAEGAVVAGETTRVQYVRPAERYASGAPFLGYEIVTPPRASSSLATADGPEGATQPIVVAGDFPGQPRVLVVDESFRVVAAATAVTQPDGTERATLDAPRGIGKRFVLVRDGRWSRPMQFDIAVGR